MGRIGPSDARWWQSKILTQATSRCFPATPADSSPCSVRFGSLTQCEDDSRLGRLTLLACPPIQRRVGDVRSPRLRLYRSLACRVERDRAMAHPDKGLSCADARWRTPARQVVMAP